MNKRAALLVCWLKKFDDGKFEMLLGIDLFFSPRSDALSTSRSGAKEARRALRDFHVEML
jgi:hypothetical protein